MLDVIAFKTIIQELFRLDVPEEEGTIRIVLQGKTFTIEKTYLEQLISTLDSTNTDSETVVYTSHQYEVLVRGEGPIPLLRRRTHSGLVMEDTANGITYEYSQCMEVIRIKSSSAKSKSEFEKLCNSFVFHIGFNLDVAIVQIRFLDELLRTNRLLQTRRTETNEVEAPKRKYLSDLVYHYQMAISTESPMLQFISFYHVMEHFFEKIYNDDLIKQVEKEITHPAFSSKKEADIKKLIKLISKKIRDRGENYTFNEQEALTLTLLKYINLEQLCIKIKEYDERLVEHYKNNEVTFSKGDKVNLESVNDTTYNRLSSRIYKTRNSIVHSKESDKARFLPFKDEKDLVDEIPLMRFLAEEIIIETSELI